MTVPALVPFDTTQMSVSPRMMVSDGSATPFLFSDEAFASTGMGRRLIGCRIARGVMIFSAHLESLPQYSATRKAQIHQLERACERERARPLGEVRLALASAPAPAPGPGELQIFCGDTNFCSVDEEFPEPWRDAYAETVAAAMRKRCGATPFCTPPPAENVVPRFTFDCMRNSLARTFRSRIDRVCFRGPSHVEAVGYELFGTKAVDVAMAEEVQAEAEAREMDGGITMAMAGEASSSSFSSSASSSSFSSSSSSSFSTPFMSGDFMRACGVGAAGVEQGASQEPSDGGARSEPGAEGAAALVAARSQAWGGGGGGSSSSSSAGRRVGRGGAMAKLSLRRPRSASLTVDPRSERQRLHPSDHFGVRVRIKY
tara:strand:- start:4045 stop:5160 length:1116 start_codon:yes stop_codon:yes gene_type:complete